MIERILLNYFNTNNHIFCVLCLYMNYSNLELYSIEYTLFHIWIIYVYIWNVVKFFCISRQRVQLWPFSHIYSYCFCVILVYTECVGWRVQMYSQFHILYFFFLNIFIKSLAFTFTLMCMYVLNVLLTFLWWTFFSVKKTAFLFL